MSLIPQITLPLISSRQGGAGTAGHCAGQSWAGILTLVTLPFTLLYSACHAGLDPASR
jgi:hypothetical protein